MELADGVGQLPCQRNTIECLQKHGDAGYGGPGCVHNSSRYALSFRLRPACQHNQTQQYPKKNVCAHDSSCPTTSELRFCLERNARVRRRTTNYQEYSRTDKLVLKS